mmetsp:Transcript_67569/g.218195  ORF Transcript_67569/g.218195 Transcript_67569/m.218195 type:complete len:205 (-) Transcript_67569:741-1355(-)
MQPSAGVHSLQACTHPRMASRSSNGCPRPKSSRSLPTSTGWSEASSCRNTSLSAEAGMVCQELRATRLLVPRSEVETLSDGAASGSTDSRASRKQPKWKRDWRTLCAAPFRDSSSRRLTWPVSARESYSAGSRARMPVPLGPCRRTAARRCNAPASSSQPLSGSRPSPPSRSSQPCSLAPALKSLVSTRTVERASSRPCTTAMQ